MKKVLDLEHDFIQLSRTQEFLVNYLGGRRKEWGIHEPVQALFQNIMTEIHFLIDAGFLIDTPESYKLTQSGTEVSQRFRQTEKQRRKECERKIFELSFQGDFLAAHNVRAKYERESVIPHGIFITFGGSGNDEHWAEVNEIPYNVKNYIALSHKLDFSDINNTDYFKTKLRNFYIGTEIDGGKMEVPRNLEDLIGETLNCPSLDRQLEEKCQFKNPPKLIIYLDTKITVLYHIEVGKINKWDGKFMLGMYDCTNPFHAAMAEFEELNSLHLDCKLPKTFETFWKHKQSNSDKYKSWIAAKEKRC